MYPSKLIQTRQVRAISDRLILIMNSEFHGIWASLPPETRILSDQLAFDSFLKKAANTPGNTEGILITVELNWGNRAYADLYGLDLVQKLRARGFRCPITITSYIPKNLLMFSEKFPEERLRYLEKDPSVQFVSLMELEKGGQNCLYELFEEALDESLWEELMHSLYNKSGYLRKILHDISTWLRCLNADILKERIADSFLEISINFPERLAEIALVETEILDLIQANSSWESWSAPIHVKLERLKNLLCEPYKPGLGLENEIPARGLSILIIDDEEKEIDLLEKRLMAVNNLSKLLTCHRAKNLKEALMILENDRNNQIRVVICDSRFYDEKGRFARNQGYHIINAIDKMKRLTSFIALTGIEPGYLYRLQKNVSCRIVPFLKEKVLEDEYLFTHFVRWILELDKSMADLLRDKFNFNNSKYLKQYLRHKNAPDFASVEMEISEKACKIVMKTKKGALPLSTGDYHINQYSSKILDKNSEEKNLKNFRTKLLGRRIALGLYQIYVLNRGEIGGDWVEGPQLEKGWIKIFLLLKYGDIKGKMPESSQFADLFNTNLRLWKSKNYAYMHADNKILSQEEIVWIKEHGQEFSKLD